MKAQKWIFDKGNCRIVTEDDAINVLYTDKDESLLGNDELLQCPDSVFQNITDLHNKNIHGWHLGSDGSIDLYLLDEGLCTQEAREFICDELYNNYYSKLKS